MRFHKIESICFRTHNEGILLPNYSQKLLIFSGKGLWTEIIEKYVFLKLNVVTITSRNKDQHIPMSWHMELLLISNLYIVERNLVTLFHSLPKYKNP